MKQANRMTKEAHLPDTPKADRKREPVVVVAMVNPMKTLGHPARGRKHY